MKHLSLMQCWLRQCALAQATAIAQRDQDDVRDSSQVVTEVLCTAEIARNLQKLTQLKSFPAATIARTETNAAATFGPTTATIETNVLGINLNGTGKSHRES